MPRQVRNIAPDDDQKTIKENNAGTQSIVSDDKKKAINVTIQLEQFFTIFFEETTAVMLKQMRSEEIKPAKAYHQFRQLMIYVEGLHKMMYEDSLTNTIVNYFIGLPDAIGTVKQDKDMYQNYCDNFREVLRDIAADCDFKQQKRMNEILHQTMLQLEHDYGFESGLEWRVI